MSLEEPLSRRTVTPALLVIGGTGQIGFELIRELAALGRVIAPSRAELDLARPESIREFVRRARPDVIVNAGAYTAVDQAESDHEACFAINARAPRVLAEEAQRAGALLVHYSSDYVFDGRKRAPYVESDEPCPLNAYGESKLAGERAIAEVGGAWIVLRTAWVYGMRGNNFLLTVLRLAREQDELRIVDDQIGAPTWCREVARATAAVLTCADANLGANGSAPPHGLFHCAAAGSTSWFGLARAILANDPKPAKQRARRVVPIATADYPTPAIRPRWSVLDSSKFAETFGLSPAPWEEQLVRAFSDSDVAG